jgi:DNA-binding NtrC family response regulator
MRSSRLALAERVSESAKPEPSKKSASADSQTGGATVTDQILFVDDDKHTLDGYQRLLHGEFRVSTAPGGEQGLASIRLLGPFALVISDMRMPGLNGAEFLARVRKLSPCTVRMLLTGYRDIDLAIQAVNEGQIFRYLTKPCGRDELVAAIRLGLTQYRTNVEDDTLKREAREKKLTVPSSTGPKPFLVR